jgi:hypothetical protein
MVYKIPVDQMSTADAKRVCKANGIKWPEFVRRYKEATGRSLFTSYTATRVHRGPFVHAVTAWHVERSKYPNMNSQTASVIAEAADRAYNAMLSQDPTAANRFADLMGLGKSLADIPNRAHPVVIAERFMDWMTGTHK